MTQAFSRVRFIMVNPSHPGNVGSAARAIKTMGFSELVLVEPKFPDV
ncbi:MAG TPA: RNA methyltransferase, partial [Achromobacter sp.]|nr:RNA methyltransferase [Achromobacter sp.]